MRSLIIIFLIIGSLKVFGTNPSVLPKGFKPKNFSYVSFRENKGQVHDQNHKTRHDVLFSGHSSNFVFHLTKKGVIYQLHKQDSLSKVDSHINNFKRRHHTQENNNSKVSIHRVELEWINANLDSRIVKGDALPGHDNYYLESYKGRVEAKSYESVTYKELYKGIDLIYYEKNGKLKYDYQVAAGANYKQILIKVNGAEKISINENGELVIKTTLGDIVEQAPVVYQHGKQIVARWVLIGNVARFDIRGINPLEPFTIDPLVMNWGTFYGGTKDDEGWDCTVDDSGNVYLRGKTSSSDNIASTGSWQSVNGAMALFFVKFNNKGERIWGTYFDVGVTENYGFVVDDSCNVYLFGDTKSSNNISTPNGWQKDFGGNTDAFLIKFNKNGVRVWGTYYGNYNPESGTGCAVDDSGNVYLSGQNGTGDFYGPGPDSSNYLSTEGCYQRFNGGGSDAFLVKFDANGMRIWGTYFGKYIHEYYPTCTVDAWGNVYIAGYSDYGGKWGMNWEEDPSVKLYADAFIAKFNSKGEHLWSTYPDGGKTDKAWTCSVDASGNVYLVGSTESTWLIRSKNSWQNVNQGNTDAFLIKFNSKGERVWDTYYGGEDYDEAWLCTVDILGNVYLVGTTSSTHNIASPGIWQDDLHGNSNDFLAKFDSNGVRQWGTYFGDGTIYNCVSDNLGNFYLTGTTDAGSSQEFNSDSWQNIPGGLKDAFLIKFSLDCDQDNKFVSVIASDTMVCSGNPVVLKAIGANAYKWNNGVVNGVPFIPASTKSYKITGFDSYGCWDTTHVTITVNPNPSQPIIYSSSNTICDRGNFLLTSPGYSSYQWYLNDIKLIGANTKSYTPLVNGNYTIKTGHSLNNCQVVSEPYSIQLSSNLNSPVISAYGSPHDTLLSCSTPAVQYQWYADGRLIVGANSQNYRVRYNGDYSVDIKTPYGCRMHSKVHQTEYPGYISILKSGYLITDSTIVEMDNNDLSWIHIYPNPANEIIYVKSLTEFNETIRIELYNDKGELVDDKEMNDQTSYLTLNISTLPSGIYLLNICNGSKQSKEKIIKY